NAAGVGKNYAITVGGTAPNPAGLTTNYNDLYATGTGGFVGLFNAVDQPALSDWQTATGQDANTISADPQFVAPNGTATTVDLHILPPSPAKGAGLAIAGVTNDFDNDSRPLIRPDIGADQIVSPTAADGNIGGTITDCSGAILSCVPINMSGSPSPDTINEAHGRYSFDAVETHGLSNVS